jgi:hypothetical protein
VSDDIVGINLLKQRWENASRYIKEIDRDTGKGEQQVAFKEKLKGRGYRQFRLTTRRILHHYSNNGFRLRI